LALHCPHVVEPRELDRGRDDTVWDPLGAEERQGAAQGAVRVLVQVLVRHHEEVLRNVTIGMPDALECQELPDSVALVPDKLGEVAVIAVDGPHAP
jgi:hypothetical protein